MYPNPCAASVQGSKRLRSLASHFLSLANAINVICLLEDYNAAHRNPARKNVCTA